MWSIIKYDSPQILFQIKNIWQFLDVSFTKNFIIIRAAHCNIVSLEVKYALLYLSTSMKVFDIQVYTNLSGKANELLRFVDLNFFKETNCRKYGFGNLSHEKTTGKNITANVSKTSLASRLLR